MKIELMRKIEVVPIGSIKPYENNPRVNDDAVLDVANSIQSFGFDVPITVDRDSVIVTGHTRYKAAQHLKLKEVPVIRLSHLKPAQIKAYRLADNKVAEKSEWHNAKLELELVQLEELKIDMSAFGFVKEQVEEADKSQGKKLDAMELRAFEHYDYLVFVFDNQMDWLNVLQAFDIQRVDGGYNGIRKVGLGRVIRGEKLIEKIGRSSSDTVKKQK